MDYRCMECGARALDKEMIPDGWFYREELNYSGVSVTLLCSKCRKYARIKLAPGVFSNVPGIDANLKTLIQFGREPPTVMYTKGEMEDPFEKELEEAERDLLETVSRGERPTQEQLDEALIDTNDDEIAEYIAAEHHEQVPIPKEVLESNVWPDWITPTPSEVQRVFETLSECWKYIKYFGKMPFYKEPKNMTDKWVDLLLYALNDEFSVQFYGWGEEAGFSRPTHFNIGELSLEDKRTIAAMIQKVFHEQRLQDKLM